MWKDNHQSFWGNKTMKEIQAEIDSDPWDRRSAMCHHIKPVDPRQFCPDCDYSKPIPTLEPIQVKVQLPNLKEWK